MDLETFFAARSVAVVGASAGRYYPERLRENLEAGSDGPDIMPVHPRERRVWGRTARPRLEALPEKPDVVFCLVPHREALETLRTMARLGIERAVVLAAPPGGRAAASLGRAARQGGIALLGPESLGLLDVPAGLHLFCGRLTHTPAAGRVSIVSRSGGLAVECLRAGRGDPRWGIRRLVCTGLESSVGAGDVVDMLARDEETDAVILCLERDPAVALLASSLERLAQAGKRAVVLSSAPSRPTDPRAFASGDPAALEAGGLAALVRHADALLARDVDEVVEAAAFVSSHHGRTRPVSRVWLASVSAGVGQWMEREARDAGLDVAKPGRAASRALREVLPERRRPTNPLDLSTAGVEDPEIMQETVRILARERGVDGVVVAMHPPMGDSFSDARNARWLETIRETDDPRGPVVMAVQATASVAPPAPGIVRGLRSAFRLLAWTPARSGPSREEADRPGDIDEERLARTLYGPARTLSEPSSRTCIEAYGIALDPWAVAETPSQAASRARALDGPACLKIASPDIPSKRAVGGVRTPLVGEGAVRDALIDITSAVADRAPDARTLGVLVTRHRDTDQALFATAVHAPGGSPPLIGCGAGDRRRGAGERFLVAPCPLDAGRARTLAEDVLVLASIDADPDGLADVLRRLSLLAADRAGDISLVDVDTIVPVEDGWRCLDARIVIRREVERPGRRSRRRRT